MRVWARTQIGPRRILQTGPGRTRENRYFFQSGMFSRSALASVVTY